MGIRVKVQSGDELLLFSLRVFLQVEHCSLRAVDGVAVVLQIFRRWQVRVRFRRAKHRRFSASRFRRCPEPCRLLRFLEVHARWLL